MGKYIQTNFRNPNPRTKQAHPIWRGIGCILMVVVPLISFALAKFTIQINNGLPQQFIPYQLLGTPYIPASWWTIGVFNPILFFIESLTDLYAILIFMVLYSIVIGALISVVGAFFYQSLGASRYGPQDAPPPKIKVKPYKR